MNGAIRSLMNFLSVIDKEKYQVDLFVYDSDGELSGEIPDRVNILPRDYYMYFFETAYKNALKSGNLFVKATRTLASIQRKLGKYSVDKNIKYALWRRARTIDTEYDVAVAWTEGNSHQFIIEKVNAKVKIGWHHIDDKACPSHTEFQKKVFPKLDYIVTVSETCKKILIEKYRLQEHKIRVVRNIMPVDRIKSLAGNSSPYPIDGKTNVLMLARAEGWKNINVATDAVKMLYSQGEKVHLWIFGGGYTDEQYNSKLPYLSINKSVNNPYPYMKFCDIYIQPSKDGEAWGMAVNEAKLLGVPVIVSDIDVFKEQVENEETGLIFGDTEKELAKSIIRLKEDRELYRKIQDNLSQGQYSNIEDIEIFYRLVEEG